jgi:hypothetical protein
MTGRFASQGERSAYLLGGRRLTIADLITGGLLAPGALIRRSVPAVHLVFWNPYRVSRAVITVDYLAFGRCRWPRVRYHPLWDLVQVHIHP